MSKVPDQSAVQLSSPDVRASNGSPIDPFWPEKIINFPATPFEVSEWADNIFAASEFLTLFEQEENNNE